jgi:thioredoxin reductase
VIIGGGFAGIAAAEFVGNSGWINHLEGAEARMELGEIASAVLGIGSDEHEALMKELAEGRFSIVQPAAGLGRFKQTSVK